ncbi:MAG TPA: helix-turn-helix domain-containing protein [Gemmatimonas sp.]|uniref:TetR/AcrR family transcriptional regulator n=1 Tax=Gemmatimonas sp. TaxID=1962908 RepID=UPI002ED81B6B
MSTSDEIVAAPDSGRLESLLDAALGVFMRYGYRKTSMQDVADAAQISRQGLYLHFAAKEQLFRAVVMQFMTRAQAAAELAMEDPDLESALVNAFDAWMGEFVGLGSAVASDLREVGPTLIGPIAADCDAQFQQALARRIAASPLASLLEPLSLSPTQLAVTLHAVARGHKHSATSREQFRTLIGDAVRMMCAPLLLHTANAARTA